MSQKPVQSRNSVPGDGSNAANEKSGADHPGSGALSMASSKTSKPQSSLRSPISSQSSRTVSRTAAGPSRAIAANDDRPAIGGLVYALQQRPSKSPFYFALAASTVWLLLGGVIGWSILTKPEQNIATATDLLASPAFIAIIATVFVPIALFWFLAVLVWRAQELRLMSSAMTEVAVRLAEPDKMAEQSVASLGQTVRRQVAAMNDAISRALGRAGELEALVHNEVAALERSYSENENRIRNLINELASEREALANNSERVSEALQGIGTQVTREINTATERASKSMSQATSTLADTLASRGNKITAAVTAAGTEIDEKLAERGSRITDQLVKHGAQAAEQMHRTGLEINRSIQETSDRTAAAISAKGNNLVASVMSMSERVGREIPVLLERLGSEQSRLSGIIEVATKNLSNLENAVADRTDALSKTLGERTNMLNTVLTEKGKVIDNTLNERIHALETILGRRAQAFDASLSERTKSLDDSVARYTGNIRETLDQQSRSIEKSLARQAHSLHESMSASAGQIQRTVQELAKESGNSSDALGSHTQMLKEVSTGLLNQVHTLTKRFEEQGANIVTAARTLEIQNSKIDKVMDVRQSQLGQLIESMNGRATELDRMMHHYSSMLEQSLAQAETRAKKVTELMARDSAEKSQTAVKDLERLRAEAQAHTARAISELKTSFASLQEQVSNQLSGFTSSFSETAQEFQTSTSKATAELAETQSELKRHAQSLPETTKQSAKAMRRALQDQLSALDSLTEVTQRHGYAGQVSRSGQQGGRSEGEQRSDGGGGQKQQPANPQSRPQLEAGNQYDPPRQEPPAQKPRSGGNDWSSKEQLEVVSAGLIQRMDPKHGGTPVPEGSAGDGVDYESTVRRSAGYGSIPSYGGASDSFGDSGGGANWSLGDLLARASQSEDEFGGKDDTSYGMPGAVEPYAEKPGSEPSPMVFEMKDIAAAVDEDIAIEVWRRYNQGEHGIVSRNIYNREGQATFDQVKRRYENDLTFRHIVDRYLADFDRMLSDARKADPRGRTVQNHLTSETGRIYLVLSHASGRLTGR
jgi:hypothetical protein